MRRIATGFTVPLEDAIPNLREVKAQIRNLSDHSDTVGVYMDVTPPGGVLNPFGCLPNGRIIQTSVLMGGTPSDTSQVNVFADTGTLGDGLVEFSCTNLTGALGKTYTIRSVADLHADDLFTDTNSDGLADCRPGALQSLACFNALANDDDDPPDNRRVRNAPKVQ